MDEILGVQRRLDDDSGAILGQWLMVERGALGGMHTLRRYSLHLYLVRALDDSHVMRVRIVPGHARSAHARRTAPASR